MSFQDSLHAFRKFILAQLPIVVVIEGHQPLDKTFAVIFCIARSLVAFWTLRRCIRVCRSASATVGASIVAFSALAWDGQFVSTQTPISITVQFL